MLIIAVNDGDTTTAPMGADYQLHIHTRHIHSIGEADDADSGSAARRASHYLW